LNNTSLQVNLLDIHGNPTETNVGMTLYDQHTGAIRYNFIHTMNTKGFPDTLRIDPLATYRLVVHTLPPVMLENMKATPGKHTVVGVDAPQGSLFLKLEGSREYKDLKAIVRQAGKMKTLYAQSFNTTEKYIVGTYDLEVLTLPRMYINDVQIDQSKTTTVEIPKPGIVTVIANNPGISDIYVESDNRLEWIYSLDENLTRESLTLQPGKYHAIYRAKNAKESIYTVDREFRVTSGSSSTVTVY
jgi:Ca-activated chloride channel family protein